MPERLLQMGDVRNMDSPEKVANLFQLLGYRVPQTAQPLAIKDLELPERSTEAIWDAYLIADHTKGPHSLQVLLFQLAGTEWETAGAASSRMRAIAQSLSRRASNFLLLGTHNYDQLMLVNPRKTLDAQGNLKVGIRKLLIDRTKPTPYDRDQLEAIAAHNLDPQALYKRQCEAFDVEKLTKDFYQGYQKVFEWVQEVIQTYNPHPYFDDPGRLHQFSQRFLGRIMFLYFLQKKEFLAGDRDFLKNQYRGMRPDPSDTDFYADLLEPLFFETLNRERDNFDSPWGKIPYLNGGLFEKDYGGHLDPAGFKTPETITLPNTLFEPSGEKGVLKFFNSYNFTISENIEGDEDVAVDPEMLGKVFENMLAADERGQSGTFYTPRGIVQFMCVEALSRYLADESGMDLEAVRKLTEYTPEMADAEVNKILTKEQAKRLKKALESVKVCDPAVGSGAFPMGMMQVILTVRQAIARREGMTVQRGSLALSEWKREIIANNLYGVDIKPEAIEIAKLRMWLSLVVDIPRMDDVEPLPNLDYKLMSGNSLISRIYGEQMIPDPTQPKQMKLAVDPIQEAIQALSELQQQYFDANEEQRKVLRADILEAEKQVFRVAIAARRQYWQGKQTDLQTNIRKLGGRPTRIQTQEQEKFKTKLKELDQIEVDVERGLRSLDFFQWHLHFNEVFREKGGFDVVIGNPPYVRQEKLGDQFKASLKVEFPELFKGTADIYTYFYGRGVELLRDKGHLTFISSNKYMRSGYGDKLRKFLGEQATVHQLIDFGDAAVFEAIAYPSILLLSKAAPHDHQAQTLTWEIGQSVDELSSVFKSNNFLMAQKELTSDGWRLETPSTLRLLEKLRNAGTPLGEYVDGRFYYGIKTGLNEAFVVDRATRDRLIDEHPSSAEVLKPFLRGKDVKRWSVNHPDLWLLFIPWHFPLHEDTTITGASVEAEKEFEKRYPAVFNHLLQFEEQLSARNKAETGIRYEWYALQRCAATYWHEFYKPKIIYQEIATYQAFSWDESGAYSNNKTFLIPDASYYLLAVLNSKFVWFFLNKTASKLQGGAYAMQTEYVSQIPIPKFSAQEEKIISDLAQKCLSSKGQDVSRWEAEINDRVAHLYGLTPEDIKIIEGGN